MRNFILAVMATALIGIYAELTLIAGSLTTLAEHVK